jgi:hypothetical protein
LPVVAMYSDPVKSLAVSLSSMAFCPCMVVVVPMVSGPATPSRTLSSRRRSVTAAASAMGPLLEDAFSHVPVGMFPMAFAVTAFRWVYRARLPLR